jgi:transcriptional regulator of acetoin/glycerol metabolism
MKINTLCQRRSAIEHQRSNFQSDRHMPKPSSVSKDILLSWQRSAEVYKRLPQHAPIDDEYLTSSLWKESPLSTAAKSEQSNLEQLAKEGQMVAAIADPCGRLLWTHSSNYMRKFAENLNFTAGGHWNEQTMGTNAVGLSLKLKKAVTVFSSEHCLPFVQDWVCYAAPIIHPKSGECFGVIDISTTWNKHTPLGQAATQQLANAIAQCLPTGSYRAELEIHALGQPKIIYQGEQVYLPPRQLEILCLLALNPDGLSLQRLHSALYGDANVSTTTLKADVSHLRSLFNGQVGSRPYRLAMPVWADFVHIWDSLSKKNTSEAMSTYRGAFLPKSESPDIEEWRYCIDAVMNQAINECKNSDELISNIQKNRSGGILVRERLIELAS